MLITQIPGIFVGDGQKLFLVGKDGSIYDKSFYLDGSSGLESLYLGLIVGEKIDWLKEKDLEKQGYGRKRLYAESHFVKKGVEIVTKDWVRNRIFIRKIHSSKPVEFSLLMKFWPERSEESCCLVKDKSVISFKSSDGEKNVFYSPNFKGTIPTRSHFDEKTGYISYFYPIDAWVNKRFVKFDLREKGSQFLKDFSKVKVMDRCTPSPIAMGVLEGSEITLFYFSTRDSFKKVERKIKSLKVERSQGYRDLDEAVVKMLTNKETGLPIAAPEYENPKQPFQSSGGYGYCWFRDAMKIFEASPEMFRKFLETFMEKNYDEIPQRVWAFDGSIAPSWSIGYLVKQPWNYQLDQLASFVQALAKYLQKKRKVSKEEERLLVKFSRKLLDRSYPNGMPIICVSHGEDQVGVFSHTAGTYLQAFLEASKAFEKLGFSKLAKEMKKRTIRLSKSVDIFWKKNAFNLGLYFPEETLLMAKTFGDLKKVDYRKGKLITLLDSGTFELINALLVVDFERFNEKIVLHLEKTVPPELLHAKPFQFKGLWRKARKIQGLVRSQGDKWRRNPGRFPEKIWSLSTLEGVYTLLLVSKNLEKSGDKDLAKQFFEIALDLFKVFKDKPLLAEQYYDNGNEDSAIPLGWSHALRFKIKKMLKTEFNRF